MKQLKRREFLKTTAGVAAGATVGPMIWVKDAQAQWTNTPEKDAKLRVLRWKRFVQGDEDQYLANIKKFTEKTGIEVASTPRTGRTCVPRRQSPPTRARVRTSSCRPTTMRICIPTSCSTCPTSANIWARNTAACTRLRSYLRQDGRVDRGAPRRGRRLHRLPREPRQSRGVRQVSARHRWLSQAVQGAEGQGHAARVCARQRYRRRQHLVPLAALGVRRQAGRREQQGRDRLQGNAQALEYAKELYGTFVPGTLSWLDPNNNKAFLDEQICLTNNGISIYYAAKTSKDPKVAGAGRGHQSRQHADRADRQAERVPAVLHPDDLQVHQVSEGGQGIPALHDGRRANRTRGCRPHRLRDAALTAYEKNPIWTSDPSTRRIATR